MLLHLTGFWQLTCRSPGRLRRNQGCAQMPAMPMRCAGAATRMRDSRSTHSALSRSAGGMSYWAQHILCKHRVLGTMSVGMLTDVMAEEQHSIWQGRVLQRDSELGPAVPS